MEQEARILQDQFKPRIESAKPRWTNRCTASPLSRAEAGLAASVIAPNQALRCPSRSLRHLASPA